ncbi:hypothetical protein, partial [Pseudomonas aeruginosa]
GEKENPFHGSPLWVLHGAAGSDPGAAGSTISNGGLLCRNGTALLFLYVNQRFGVDSIFVLCKSHGYPLYLQKCVIACLKVRCTYNLGDSHEL